MPRSSRIAGIPPERGTHTLTGTSAPRNPRPPRCFRIPSRADSAVFGRYLLRKNGYNTADVRGIRVAAPARQKRRRRGTPSVTARAGSWAAETNANRVRIGCRMRHASGEVVVGDLRWTSAFPSQIEVIACCP